MQLPQELQRFEFPSLILVADRVHAQFWLAHGDTLEEVDLIRLDKDEHSDKEGREIGQELSDDNRLHQYIHLVVDRLEQIMNEGVADSLHLVMETELADAVIDHSSQEIQEQVGKQVHADLMKEEPLDVIRRVLEA
jgi:hypothetical protein